MEIEKIIDEKLVKTDANNILRLSKENAVDSSYYHEFVKMLKVFQTNLSDSQMKGLINKFNFNRPFVSYPYMQSAAELTILYFILRKYNQDFLYEPMYNTKKNPECSFVYAGKIINIEVKCPDYTKRLKQSSEKGIEVMFPERFFETEKIREIANMEYINLLSLLDNKLKDYVESAHQKFPTTNDEYFNVLVIGLNDIENMDEWYIYLCGDKGLFSNCSFIETDFNNIDAFLLTDVARNHLGPDGFCNKSWKLENNKNLFLLNPKNNNKEFYWKKALDLFGPFTRSYHDFVLKMDDESEKNWRKYENREISLEQYNAVHQVIKYKFISTLVEYNAKNKC